MATFSTYLARTEDWLDKLKTKMALLQTLRKTASHGLRAAPRSSALYCTCSCVS